MQYKLSIIIPGKNEEFMERTIEDVLENTSEITEIIAVLDGYLPNPPLKSNPRLTIIYNPESKGQRGAVNQGVKLSQSKYVCKLDSHCAIAPGFDVEMIKAMEELGDDTTLIPSMKNLHAFDWICPDGHRRYQGPSGPCQWIKNGEEWVYAEKKNHKPTDIVCNKPTVKDIVWIVKHNPTSTTYRFDRTMHFQYFKDLDKRQTGDFVETLSIQGSCFMATKQKYQELDLCSEEFNSWGQNGVEVACKTWLSGGRLIVNKKTWYSHMFRTQGGDFGFPYHNPESKINENRELSRKMFQRNGWPKAIHTFQWLLDKFAPIPEWETPTKEIIYYTCNSHKPEIDNMCREQLLKAGLPIVSVSLNKDLDFGNTRLRIDGEKSPLMMHKQMLMGLKASKADVVYLVESDVLYPPEHFTFTPERKDVFYFDTNVWKLRWADGHCVWTDDLQQLSGMCIYRELITEFIEKRIEQIEKEGFNRHYEPSPRQSIFKAQPDGKYSNVNYQSSKPMVCIRHDTNITASKWSIDDYRNKEFAKGWTEAESIPFWGKGNDLIR